MKMPSKMPSDPPSSLSTPKNEQNTPMKPLAGGRFLTKINPANANANPNGNGKVSVSAASSTGSSSSYSASSNITTPNSSSSHSSYSSSPLVGAPPSTTTNNTTLKSSSSSSSTKYYKTSCIFLLALFGTLFIIVGLLFYLFVLHALLHRIISEKLVLAEGSETFEKWRVLPMPVYYRYYFFNVTNPQDIERNGARPIVKEIGPFTYRSQWTKNPVQFHPNGTVSFRELKTMEFVRKMSVASDRARILTTINGPLTITLALLQKAPLVVRNIVSLGLSTMSEGFFVKRSARELLFDGYPETLTSFGPLLNPTIPKTNGRFAWLYGRNNTDDGQFTVFTGRDDFTKINQIDRYNGEPELNYWKSNSNCNRLSGATDGQLVATNDQHTFDLFHPELCRKITFNADELALNSKNFLHENFQNESGQHLSDIKITVDRYVPDMDTLSSIDDYPPNECYQSKLTPSKPELGDILVSIRQNQSQRFNIRPFFRKQNGRIIFRSGVFDMSECKYGAPVLFSYPHFFQAHSHYRANVAGLRPDPKLHQFHMMIEPITGATLRSYARIQINVYVTKPPWISRFRNMPELVFPVFWQELSAEATNDMIEHINWALTKPFMYADWFSIIMIIIGLVLVTLSGYYLFGTINLKQVYKRTSTKRPTTTAQATTIGHHQQQQSTTTSTTTIDSPATFTNQAMQFNGGDQTDHHDDHDDDEHDRTIDQDPIESRTNQSKSYSPAMATAPPNEYASHSMMMRRMIKPQATTTTTTTTSKDNEPERIAYTQHYHPHLG